MKTFIDSSEESREFHCHCLELQFNVILVLIVARIFTPGQELHTVVVSIYSHMGLRFLFDLD